MCQKRVRTGTADSILMNLRHLRLVKILDVGAFLRSKAS